MREFRIGLVAIALSVTSAAAHSATLTIFAAASLRDGLAAALSAYAASSGEEVVVSYAGSSILARQIERGAPADVFISANEAWMDTLEQAGDILPGSRVTLLSNALVLVGTGKDAGDGAADVLTPTATADAIGDERIAMALVDAVPAGIYGKEALTAFGLWDRLSGQVVQSDNVRSALALVERGEAPFGIVYATDARAGDVTLVGVFPPESHTPITYPMAIVAGRDGPAVRRLYGFLQSDDAFAHFAAAGFTKP